MLDPRTTSDLKSIHAKLERGGKLLTRARLAECWQLFRERFGPEVLARLDGEELLNTMHLHGNRESLVYWLEFKEDEEMPARFGSIAGGSALKFIIYRSVDTGEWMTGSAAAQRRISVQEAIEYARRHRDQLIRGCELLDSFTADASAADYQGLQDQMDEQAPDVSRLAWGHKYFALLHPDKLDDYHSPTHQRFHLIKILCNPPEGDGRYVAAWYYQTACRELGWPVNHLTTVLNERNGNPHRYWRIGTKLGGKDTIWPLMRNESCVAVGWTKLPDLSSVASKKEWKDRIRSLLREHYETDPQVTGRTTQKLFNFVATIEEGDIVAASDGETVLGVGKVQGPYTYEPGSKAPHRRPVKWLALEEFKVPEREGLRSTVHQLRKAVNLISIEAHLLSAAAPPPNDTRLAGIPGRIQDILERKGQVILYGPPGTGKTYWAERTACELAAMHNFGKTLASLSPEENALLVQRGDESRGYVRTCCFHPSYGYEDFLEGYHPVAGPESMQFALRPGIFTRLCYDSSKEPARRFFLIIDEINRGDIPRIFGELLTVLEKTKRGKGIILPISRHMLSVPENLFIIGTMNTADRSIALLDTALRRRFGFIELMPDSSVLTNAVLNGIPLGLWLTSLNRRICEHVGRDACNLQIGHSYLMERGAPVADFRRFRRIVREDVIPLLEEYCYEDYGVLEKILGTALVDNETMSIREELFDGAHDTELVSALQAACPEISTTQQAVDSEEVTPEDAEEDADAETEDAAAEQLQQ